jgi:hypothetical protein
VADRWLALGRRFRKAGLLSQKGLRVVEAVTISEETSG